MRACKVAAVVAKAKGYIRTIKSFYDAAGSPHVDCPFFVLEELESRLLMTPRVF